MSKDPGSIPDTYSIQHFLSESDGHFDLDPIARNGTVEMFFEDPERRKPLVDQVYAFIMRRDQFRYFGLGEMLPVPLMEWIAWTSE